MGSTVDFRELSCKVLGTNARFQDWTALIEMEDLKGCYGLQEVGMRHQRDEVFRIG